jgi:hypothetical protein
MKKILFPIILVMLVALILGVTPALAGEKTTVKCTETFVELLDPGAWTFPDGNAHVRGYVLLMRYEATDPRLTGYNTIVMNANFGKDGSGPLGGTWRLETDEGGIWEGTWEGRITDQGTEVGIAVGEGYGIYAGLKYWEDLETQVVTILGP